jgi:uracil-DNA glycosylase
LDEIWQVTDFEQWRTVARWLIGRHVGPSEVVWLEPGQPKLFPRVKSIGDLTDQCRQENSSTLRVAPAFIELARVVSSHSDPSRWSDLYEAVWRIAEGESTLLEIATDDLTLRLHKMHKQVSRDCHKMKAFVRFTRLPDEANEDRERYVAYHEPDHNVLALVAPFFARRFKTMHWSILTPQASANWNGERLQFGPGVRMHGKKEEDSLVQLWRDYYRATFNPARVKISAMKKEMPVRYWKNLPEAELIHELLQTAPERVQLMQLRSQLMHRSAVPYLPTSLSLSSLSEALGKCRGCDLCDNGTLAVSGEGPSNARLMIIGEQPGDSEERQGRPFVGPAGALLQDLLESTGIHRSEVYITNVVKHFHHEQRGKQRLHKRPSARHESACRPWLESEVKIVRPRIVLGLGTTAMHTLLGRQFKLVELIGSAHRSWACDQTYFSWHPAAILRTSDVLAKNKKNELSATLDKIKRQLRSTF